MIATFNGGNGVKVGKEVPVTWIPMVKLLEIKTGGLLKQYRPGLAAMILIILDAVCGVAPATKKFSCQSSMGMPAAGNASRRSIPTIVTLTGSLGRSVDTVTLIEFPVGVLRTHIVLKSLLAFKVNVTAAEADRLVVGLVAVIATGNDPA